VVSRAAYSVSFFYRKHLEANTIAIDLPIDNTLVADSRMEVTGTVSVREMVLGNRVDSAVGREGYGPGS
jgi:hypothetical protein